MTPALEKNFSFQPKICKTGHKIKKSSYKLSLIHSLHRGKYSKTYPQRLVGWFLYVALDLTEGKKR